MEPMVDAKTPEDLRYLIYNFPYFYRTKIIERINNLHPKIAELNKIGGWENVE